MVFNRESVMEEILTSRMSSKGQVEIPKPFRLRYGWDANTAFTFMVLDGSLIMQPVTIPNNSDLSGRINTLMRKCREEAKVAGLTPADIKNAIAEVRAERRQKRDNERASSR